jgi:hypothetical protein
VRFLNSGLRGAGFTVLLVAVFAGFSGCQTTNPVTTLPTPTPTPARSSTSTATVGATGTTISFATVLGDSAGFTLPAASAGSGATLTGTFSPDLPSGIAAPQSGNRSPLSNSVAPLVATQATTTTQHTGVAYISFSVSAAVTVSGTFHVTFTGTSANASPTSAFVAFFDGTAWQYDVLSNPTLTGTTLDFTAKTTAPLTFSTGKTYVWALTTDVTSTPPPITGGP